MSFGIELPPQQRAYDGFFIGIGVPLVIVSLVFAAALGSRPIRHEVA